MSAKELFNTCCKRQLTEKHVKKWFEGRLERRIYFSHLHNWKKNFDKIKEKEKFSEELNFTRNVGIFLYCDWRKKGFRLYHIRVIKLNVCFILKVVINDREWL